MYDDVKRLNFLFYNVLNSIVSVISIDRVNHILIIGIYEGSTRYKRGINNYG